MAWAPLGWRCAFTSEIDAFPRAVIAHHYPGVPLHGDFTTIRAGQFERIDVLAGGTPCQSFSVAGLRTGMDDQRGGLALEYLRLVDRLRPTWMVWENVPGVLSNHRGRDFAAFIGGVRELGYGFAWRVLDAQFFGVAQRRRRVFVVGHARNWGCAAAVLFERHSLSGDPGPGKTAQSHVAGTIGRTSYDWSRSNIAEALVATPAPAQAFALRGREGGAMPEMGGQVANALRTAGGGASVPMVAESMVRRLTPTECERLQGFPDGYTAITYRGRPAADAPRYKALGNSMAVPVMAWIGRRIAAVEAIEDPA